MKLRIGIDAREIQNQITGIGRYLLNFLETATSREDAYDYCLYYDAMPKSPFKHRKVRNIVLGSRSSFLWDHLKLPVALKKDHVDLFFSPYYKQPYFLSIPSVITVHDLGLLYMPDEANMKGNLYRFYFRQLVRSSVKGASKVIVVSDYSKKCLEEFIKVPASKIKMIYNNVSRQYQPMDDQNQLERIKEKYRIKKKYIFYSGNFNPHKNVPTLIEAYSKLNAHLISQYQLVLTGGRNKYFNDLQHLVERLHLKGHTVFTGHVSDEELVLLYNAADLFVFPSLYEGFGLPPLEAMACGTPVISSDAASLKEVVGGAAMCVSPTDVDGMAKAMEHVLMHEEIRHEMIEKGLKRSQQFNSLHTTEKILDVIDSMFCLEDEKTCLKEGSESFINSSPKDKKS